MAQPRAIELERVSPSTAEVMRRCPMELAFRLDSDFDVLSIPSTWAILGTIAHAILEAVGAGKLRGAEAGELYWAAEIERARNRLQSRLLLSPVPSPTRWQGYYQARQRALRMVPVGAHSPSSVSAGLNIAVEQRLVDDRLGLVGRVDLVAQDSSGAIIVDFKSSLMGHDGLKPAYRRQLLIYAYLWHCHSGQWPVTAEIRYLDGKSDRFRVDDTSAVEAAESAAVLRQEFNSAVAQGSVAACPSPFACRYCDYRCACDAFMSEPISGWIGPTTVLGGVTGVTRHADSLSLVLEPSSSTGQDNSPFTVRQLPLDFEVTVGQRLAFSHLGYGGPGGSGLVTWETRCFQWG